MTKIQPDQRAEVVRRYNAGENSMTLAIAYGMTDAGIRRVIKTSGGVMRSARDSHIIYKHDETAFDRVTDESAYWIGFLMADGSVSDEGRIELSLHRQDEDHVCKFRAFIKSEHPIKHGVTKHKSGRITPTVKFSVRSPHMADSLRKHGVVPRKSLIAEVPSYLQHNHHFWRGEVDGDGCLMDVKNSPSLSLLGSKHVCSCFYRFCLSVYKGEQTPHFRPCKSIFFVGTSGNLSVSVIKALYLSGTEFLTRKMRKATEMLQKYEGVTLRILPRRRKYEITPD